MKWLEIIELRSVDCNQNFIESQLHSLLRDVKSYAENKLIMAFSRSLVNTDYCIHLLHDSTAVLKQGSDLGIRLASALKEFGMVNHNIWIELIPNNKKD